MYHVNLKNNTKVIVNGETLKLRKFKKKSGLVHEEYEIPLGSKKGTIILKNMSAPQLIIDGKDCATGEDYVPVKTPKWAYLFVALHFINCINGALGAVLAVIGVSLTVAVAGNKKMNVAIRVVLCIAILLVAFLAVFGIALLASGM